ncbi:hypothetical protein C8Q77DRAFT_1139227 [Trametes polyzona]|nr:hypothetical protein C8Q77DRAFT_1139227 [Trametes polyzona]
MSAPLVLTDLPTELLVQILLVADVKALFMCKKVCHELAHLVTERLEIQYKLLLMTMGMVDGPPSPVPIVERLASLRACRAAWFAGKHPIHAAHTTERVHLCRQPSGCVNVLWNRRRSILQLYTPPSAYTGILERLVDIPMSFNTQSFADLPRANVDTWDAFAVDAEQNLLVLPHRSRSHDHATITCRLINLRNPAVSHPLLASSSKHVFLAETPSGYSGRPIQSRSIRILGDLFLWEVDLSSVNWDCTITIYNWITGVVVWRIVHRGPSRCHVHLVSPTRVIMIHGNNSAAVFTIRGFEFDPGCTSDVEPTLLGDCSFTLVSPLLAPDVRCWELRTYLTFPQVPAQCSPQFLRDPSLTMLVIRMEVRNASDMESYLLCIPLTTLLAPYSSSSSAAATTTAAPDHPKADVPWAAWARPSATRLFRIIPYIAQVVSVTGLQCLLVGPRAWAGDNRATRDLFVIDLSPPFARTEPGVRPPLPCGCAGEDCRCWKAQVTATDACIDGVGPVLFGLWAGGSMHTTHPYVVTHRTLDVGDREYEGWHHRLGLSHDGLIWIDHHPNFAT